MRYILFICLFLYSTCSAQELVYDLNKMSPGQIRTTKRLLEALEKEKTDRYKLEIKKELDLAKNQLHSERLYNKNRESYYKYRIDSIQQVAKSDIKLLKESNKLVKDTLKLKSKEIKFLAKENTKLIKEKKRLQKSKNRFLYGVIILTIIILILILKLKRWI